MSALVVLHLAIALPKALDPEVTLTIRKNVGLLVILVSTILCCVRPFKNPVERTAWACIAGFLVCNTLGAAYYSAVLAELPHRPAPTVVDFFWFLRYPFLFAGIHLLIRSRTRGFSTAQWVDGAIGVCSLVGVTGVLVLEAVLVHVQNPVERAIFIAYPIANVLALGFLIGIVALKGLRLRNWTALGTS